MDRTPGDILPIKECSVDLKISKSTLYKLVREGKGPSHKGRTTLAFWGRKLFEEERA